MSFGNLGGGEHSSICREFQGDFGEFQHLFAVWGINWGIPEVFRGYFGGIFGILEHSHWHSRVKA